MVFPVVVLDAVEVLVVDFEEVVLVFSLLVEDESFLLAVEEIALLLTADDTRDTCELLAFASDTTEDDTEDTEDTDDTETASDDQDTEDSAADAEDIQNSEYKAHFARQSYYMQAEFLRSV